MVIRDRREAIAAWWISAPLLAVVMAAGCAMGEPLDGVIVFGATGADAGPRDGAPPRSPEGGRGGGGGPAAGGAGSSGQSMGGGGSADTGGAAGAGGDLGSDTGGAAGFGGDAGSTAGGGIDSGLGVGGAGGGSAGSGGSSGTSKLGCDEASSDDCETCRMSNCCDESTTCADDTTCADAYDEKDSCLDNDDAPTCYQRFARSCTEASDLRTCLRDNCPDECGL